MAEIPPQKYLDMANQSYIVAYVTGLVNSTFPRLEMFPTPSLTAVCAMTLLYDYALTLGEEASTSQSSFVRPLDRSPFASADHKNVDVSYPKTLLHPTNSHSP